MEITCSHVQVALKGGIFVYMVLFIVQLSYIQMRKILLPKLLNAQIKNSQE